MHRNLRVVSHMNGNTVLITHKEWANVVYTMSTEHSHMLSLLAHERAKHSRLLQREVIFALARS